MFGLLATSVGKMCIAVCGGGAHIGIYVCIFDSHCF